MRRLILAAVMALTVLAAACSSDTGAINDYLAFCTARLQGVQLDLRDLQRVTSNVDMRSDAWRAQMRKTLVTLRSDGEKVQSYGKVPDRAAALDRSMVAIGKDLVYVADEGVAGLDTLSPGRIDNSTSRLQILTANILEATAEANRLATASGLSLAAPTTPVAPTSAPAAPQVTATPSPADIQALVQRIRVANAGSSQRLDRLIDLSVRLDSDPTLIKDTAWRDEAWSLIRELQDQAKAMRDTTLFSTSGHEFAVEEAAVAADSARLAELLTTGYMAMSPDNFHAGLDRARELKNRAEALGGAIAAQP